MSKCLSTSFVLHMETEASDFWAQGLSYDKNQTSISRKITPTEFFDYYQGDYLDAVMYDRVYWSQFNSRRMKDMNKT